MEIAGTFGIIAGGGTYPLELAENARRAGVGRLVAVAFRGETCEEMAERVDRVEWLRVGQLGAMVKFLASEGVEQAVMAGQIAPGNLFDLRPDMKALLLLGRLRTRNAETIFGAIAEELGKSGVELVEATRFMEDSVVSPGALAGPAAGRAVRGDAVFGMRIAKETSRLDIGQTVVVKRGTVLAVEAFEGTNAAIRRGGELGGGRGVVVVKVSKPGQDFRFDVPVVGPRTLEAASESGVSAIAMESGRVLILERERVFRMAGDLGVGLMGVEYE